MIKEFSLSDQIFFSERLSLLLSSGMGVVDSLKVILKIDASKKRRKIYEMMIFNIEKGMSLSKILISEKIRFNNLLIVLIHNGEKVGNLSNSLKHASVLLQKRNELKNKIVNSLIYPFFIIFFTIIMTLFLILFIFPKILPLLNSLNIELPLITVLIQNIYNISINYGLLILIIISILTTSLILIIKKNRGANIKFCYSLINLPFLGKYIKMYYSINICYLGENILNSGKDTNSLINTLFESENNILMRESYNRIRESLMRGISLSISLEKELNLFPLLLIHMCHLGEKTGNLSIMFSNCAKVFDNEIENFLKKFTALIEPVLMVFMGIIVGSVALSIILPIYEITNHLGK
jgi:type IV pilus assembly protein PilC